MAPKPNIVLIMVDQQHPGCLGYAGHPVVRTPNIDYLARSSTTFSRAYVANPLCMPSRASLFTGLTTRGHRVRMNGIHLDPTIPTCTDALRRAGYRTHAAGKLHFGTSGTPASVPPDEVDPAAFPEARSLWQAGRIRQLPLPYHGFETVDFIGGHGHGSWGHYVQWLEREHPGEAPLFHEAAPLEPPSPARAQFNRQSYKWALPEALHPMRWIADRAVDFLDEQGRLHEAAASPAAPKTAGGGRGESADQPFFLFVSIQDPHPPFAPPAPWCFRHDPKSVPPPLWREGELDALPPHFRSQRETTLVTQGNNGQPMQDTDPYRAECAAHYYGLIEMVDEQVGRILDALQRNSLEDDTVVVFTADHGEALGDHGMWGKGPYHFDSVIRVPLLVRVPGGAPAAHAGVVSLLDLPPTFLDLAGVAIPDGTVPGQAPEAPAAPPAWAGRSLKDLLTTGTESGPARSALVEEDEDYLGFRMRTLVTDCYRLTAYSGQPYGELFDLQDDPNEYVNRWDDPDYGVVKERLRLALLDKLMETDAPLPRQTSRSQGNEGLMSTAAAGSAASVGSAGSPAHAGSWKWDVSIYDRPGWIARFRGRGRLASPDGHRLYVRFEELERSSYYGDYFMGRHRDTWLYSPDAGHTWHATTADEAPNVDGVALADGSRLAVTHTVSLLRGEALRNYLDRAGLAHMWQDESFAWWELRAPERRTQLEREGRSFHTVRHPTQFLATLRDLSVGTCPPGSRQWTWRPLEGLPPMASLAGWWRQTGVVLPDGTLLGCVQGRRERGETHDSSFALRSTDGGRSWSLSSIAKATDTVAFSESFLFLKQDGRILAMIRSGAGDAHLYRSVSADGGVSWSPLDSSSAIFHRQLQVQIGVRWLFEGLVPGLAEREVL